MSVKTSFDANQYFIVLVDSPELLERANELGYTNVKLCTKDEVRKTDITAIGAEGIPTIVRIPYVPDRPGGDGIITSRERIGDTLILDWDLAGEFSSDELPIHTIDDAKKYFPKPARLIHMLINMGLLPETDYKNRCGNCHEYMGRNDKYCRYCGTERGKGAFLPFNNQIVCVYGPPIKTKYKCPSCNYTWIRSTLGTDSAKYCPRCGKHILVIKQEVKYI